MKFCVVFYKQESVFIELQSLRLILYSIKKQGLSREASESLSPPSEQFLNGKQQRRLSMGALRLQPHLINDVHVTATERLEQSGQVNPKLSVISY